MTKLRDEEARKKKSAQAKEVIETIGQEGKAGIKAAKEYFSNEEREGEKIKDIERQILEDARKKKESYHARLAKFLVKYLSNIPWNNGWNYRVAPTDRGVLMEITSPGPRYFRSAFKATGDTKIDLNAIETYAIRAENLFDRLSQNDNHTKGGIILPWTKTNSLPK